MATMAKADFLKYAGFRPGVFLDKCSNNEGHSLSGFATDQIIIGVVTGQNAKTAKATSITSLMSNANPGQTLVRLIQSGSYNQLILQDEELVPLGKLEKTPEYQLNGRKDYNRGNIAEILFSAAIVARFKAGCGNHTRIGETEIKAIMELCKINNNTITLESPNKGTTIKDDLVFKYQIGEPHWRAVKNPKLWPMWSQIVEASIKYANSVNVVDLVAEVWGNGVKNSIIVLSDGETDQKGTKVDVRVQVTDHAGDLSGPDFLKISLKVDGVKQFGQMGGTTLDVQKKLWKDSFGIDVNMTQQSYDKLKGGIEHFNDTANAIMAVYEEVAPKVPKALLTSKGRNAFSSFVQYHFSKREEGFKLVDLKGDQAIQYDASNLEKAFKGLELVSELNVAEAQKVGNKVVKENLPKLMIFGQGSKLTTKMPLIEIRVKRGERSADGTPYYRNVFEKQEGFTVLFAQAVEID
jgi:hypothetical protein